MSDEVFPLPKADFSASRHLVYTVIIGDYDTLKTPRWRPDNVDYVAFLTGNSCSKDRGWRVVRLSETDSNPTMTNRRMKILGVDTQDYQSVTYVDGSIQVVGSLETYISELLDSGCALAVFLHPDRGSPMQELIACRNQGLLSQEQLKFEESRLTSHKSRTNLQLYDAGVLIRNPNHPRLQGIASRWFELFSENPIRDQLSLPIAVVENLDHIQQIEHWTAPRRQVLYRHPHRKNSLLVRLLFQFGAIWPDVFQSLRRAKRTLFSQK